MTFSGIIGLLNNSQSLYHSLICTFSRTKLVHPPIHSTTSSLIQLFVHFTVSFFRYITCKSGNYRISNCCNPNVYLANRLLHQKKSVFSVENNLPDKAYVSNDRHSGWILYTVYYCSGEISCCKLRISSSKSGRCSQGVCYHTDDLGATNFVGFYPIFCDVMESDDQNYTLYYEVCGST